MSHRPRRYSLSKIYVSKAEIKHTNSKIIITIYTYNRQKRSLKRKVEINYVMNKI